MTSNNPLENEPFLRIFAEELPETCAEEGKTLFTEVNDETTDDE